jgi:S-disulfanyl-L-cysteine oxidoreductase SoxD
VIARRSIVMMMAAAALGAASMAAVRAQQPAAVAERKVWDGVYTDAQAARGKERYEASCARCHTPSLTGSDRGPGVKGNVFWSKWEEASLGPLFTLIRDTMPADAGASTVSDEAKIDILAYMLQQNDFPSGAQELALAPTALDGIKVARRTVVDGVFTTDQVERGRAAFMRGRCAGCHQVDLSGDRGPALKGSEFVARWENGPVNALYVKIRDTMPPQFVAETDPKVKVDIVAFLLQSNGFPVGRSELRAETATLDSIDIVRAGAANAVSNFSLVQVVGCLTESPAKTWMLTRSSEPVATRDERPTPAQLSVAQRKPLGSESVRLISANGFKPDANAGRKVEARGLIYRDGGETRINLTSLQPVNQSCN